MKFLNIITKDKLNDPLSTLQHFGCSWNEKEIEQKMRKKPKKKNNNKKKKVRIATSPNAMHLNMYQVAIDMYLENTKGLMVVKFMYMCLFRNH
jgi:hypothetical protein